MGSCFKFTMCRKRAYDFQNQPYEPTVQTTEGRYRVSTADVEGWDPEVSLKVNGDAGEEKYQPHDVVETSVVASPSNSDVTFGETFKDANENNQEEDVKDKKKKDKSKKEKSKKEKSKKEKSKKDKSKKKSKDKEDDENTVNENVEKDQRIENDDDVETKKDEDNTGNMDISNMETLPREERHIVTHSEQTTVQSEQITSVTTQLITESTAVDEGDDKNAHDIHDNVSDRGPMEDGHGTGDGEGQGENVEIEVREPLADDKSIHSEDVQENDTHGHVRTTLVMSNSHADDIHDRKSSLTVSDSELQRLEDVEDKGEECHSIEGGAYPYPEPEEQIDVRNIRNLTDDVPLVTEESSVTIQEAGDGSAVTTVTKVIVTEVKSTIDNHAD